MLTKWLYVLIFGDARSSWKTYDIYIYISRIKKNIAMEILKVLKDEIMNI